MNSSSLWVEPHPPKPKPKAPSKSDQAKAAAGGLLMVDEKGNPVSTVNAQGQAVSPNLPGSTPGAAGTIGTGLMNQGGGAVTVGTGKPISVSNRVSAPGATPTAGASAAGGVAGGVQSHTHGPNGSFIPSRVDGKVIRPQSLAQQMALQEPNTANALAGADMIPGKQAQRRALREKRRAARRAARGKAEAQSVMPAGLTEVQKAAWMVARETAAQKAASAGGGIGSPSGGFGGYY